MASYDLSRITGNTRTNAPVVMAGHVGSRMDAARIAAAQEGRLRRQAEDDPNFRAMRREMHARHGVCG